MMLSNIKSLLVGFARDDESPSAALNYALSLAAHARAHVSVQALSMKTIAPQSVRTELVTQLVSAENSRRHQASVAVAERARQEASALGVPCSVEAPQMRYPDLIFGFGARARVHDLTVLDADSEFLSLGQGALHEALFNSGRPVLIVPSRVDQFACKRVVIAWDGSPQAARATNDALPFLRAADRVEVVSVTGEKDLSRSVPGAEIAPHLERHGVECVVKDITADDGDVGEALRREATAFSADMLVMGAFVHSRLRELIFGGVTESMLTDCTIPLFLSH